jgi:DNA modification methylase
VAAIQLGRRFVGVEQNPAHFAVACRRIEQAVSQGQLFTPAAKPQLQEELL